MHEASIKSLSAQVFKVAESDVHIDFRLMGGMSNFTYVIRVAGERYTFRIPGKNADRFVDRFQEAQHIALVESLGLNNETVYLNQDSGIKIARYIEGTPLHEQDPLSVLDEAVKVLKTVHESGLTSAFAYGPFERLERYESYVKEYNHTHHERYETYKATLLDHRGFLDQFPKVLTHGDAQVSNFVVTQDGLRLMDWEFTGMNDAFYDLACFGNANFDHALAILPVYLGHTPSDDDFNRLFLWRIFQCLQWHNVALYKDFIGLSQDLNIDFYKVSNLYLDKAEALIKQLR